MIKNLFSTPKKTAVTVLCALAILTAVGTGTAFAVSAVAESTSIGADKAKMFAFADAGVDPLLVEYVIRGKRSIRNYDVRGRFSLVR